MDKIEKIMTLNSQELIKWCRERKKALNLSNVKLSEKTGVPIGTIDRLMSGNYTEYKYSSIQPLINVLIGFSNDTPLPEDDEDKQSQYYYETIEGYKLIVDSKNQMLEQAKKELEVKQRELDYVKKENETKQKYIDDLTAHIKWLESIYKPNN